MLGPSEMIMILLVSLLVFGPDKIPEIARTLGRIMREFQKATAEVRYQMRDALSDLEEARPPRVPDLREIYQRLDLGKTDGAQNNPAKVAFESPPSQVAPAPLGLPAAGGEATVPIGASAASVVAAACTEEPKPAPSALPEITVAEIGGAATGVTPSATRGPDAAGAASPAEVPAPEGTASAPAAAPRLRSLE